MNRICRYISLVILALTFVGVSAIPAFGTTITVASVVIPNFAVPLNPGETLYLYIYVDRSFISSDGIPIQPGSPQTGRWYRKITCSVAGTNVTIPQFTLDSTTDAQDNPGKAARYSAFFYANTRLLGPYAGFESFRVLPVYSNPTPTDATWAQVRADNTAGAAIPIDKNTYTTEQINRLISDAVTLSGGIASIDGLSGPNLTFVDHTNITVTPSGSNLTIGVTGQFAVGIGGTGSSTAAGARSNLGAAASGANADITSLAALSTPLSGAQGGTGFASYTVGDLLYASSSSALSKLAGVATGQVLVSGGVATAPAWSASPTLTALTSGNVTVSALTSGRVTIAGASGILADDSAFLWDATTNRLSINTALSTERINLSNAGFLGGANAAGNAVRRLIGLNGSDYVSIAASGDRSVFGGVVTQDLTAPADLSAPDGLIYATYQNTPIAVGHATAGIYSSNGSGNNFHFASHISTTGTRNSVAIFGEAVAESAAGGTSAWAFNPVALSRATGANVAGSIAIEANFGTIAAGANNESYGIVVAAVGHSGTYGTVPGVNKNYLQMQVSSSMDSAAAPANGIVFNSSGGVNAIQTSGSLIKANGATTGAYGLDLRDFDASNGAAIFSSGDFLVGLNAANTLAMRTIGYSTADYLEIGRSTYDAAGQQGVVIYPGSAETVRITRGGATAQPGNIGLNQASPARQLHQTGIRKQALSGTNFILSTASLTVTATGSAFTTELQRGSAIEFSSEPGVAYTVATIVSDTNLTLTGMPLVNSVIATATGDYPFLLVEGSQGEDFLNYSAAHVLELYGNSTYDDLRGMIRLSARTTPAKRLLIGVDDAGTYSYISSVQTGVGWTQLCLQCGASGSNAGGVVIGVPTASSVGAMLKVEGAGAKTANHVGSEFNNISTSVAAFQKIGAQYISSGSWIGPNVAGYFAALGALETTDLENRSNLPVVAVGGKSFFGPHGTQVATPSPFTTLTSTATVDIYGYATENVTVAADTAGVDAAGLVTGSGTQWNNVGNVERLRVGDAVMFGTDTEVYEIGSITSGTVVNLSTVYNGTPASGLEVYRDPILLRVRNSYGTERFRVESSGYTKVNGTFVQKFGTTLASAATLTLGSGNVFFVTGNVTITNIWTFSGGIADASEAGREITIVWGPAGGDTFDVTDGGNLKLNGNVTAADSDDTLTLVFDGALWYEKARSPN